jgi:hypothetical protein
VVKGCEGEEKSVVMSEERKRTYFPVCKSAIQSIVTLNFPSLIVNLNVESKRKKEWFCAFVRVKQKWKNIDLLC